LAAFGKAVSVKLCHRIICTRETVAWACPSVGLPGSLNAGNNPELMLNSEMMTMMPKDKLIWHRSKFKVKNHSSAESRYK